MATENIVAQADAVSKRTRQPEKKHDILHDRMTAGILTHCWCLCSICWSGRHCICSECPCPKPMFSLAVTHPYAPRGT